MKPASCPLPEKKKQNNSLMVEVPDCIGKYLNAIVDN